MLNLFVNNTYKVLSCLYDKIDGNNLVRITQEELSAEVGITRVTVNKIMKELIKNDFIEHDKAHIGHYYITNKGKELVKNFRKSDGIGGE